MSDILQDSSVSATEKSSFNRFESPSKGNTQEGSKSSMTPTRTKRHLPSAAVQTLKDWLMAPAHFHHPYPTETQKKDLVNKTGIRMKQLNNWFTNARKRIWRPVYEKRRQLEEEARREEMQQNWLRLCSQAEGGETKRTPLRNRMPRRRSEVDALDVLTGLGDLVGRTDGSAALFATPPPSQSEEDSPNLTSATVVEASEKVSIDLFSSKEENVSRGGVEMTQMKTAAVNPVSTKQEKICLTGNKSQEMKLVSSDERNDVAKHSNSKDRMNSNSNTTVSGRNAKVFTPRLRVTNGRSRVSSSELCAGMLVKLSRASTGRAHWVMSPSPSPRNTDTSDELMKVAQPFNSSTSINPVALGYTGAHSKRHGYLDNEGVRSVSPSPAIGSYLPELASCPSPIRFSPDAPPSSIIKNVTPFGDGSFKNVTPFVEHTFSNTSSTSFHMSKRGAFSAPNKKKTKQKKEDDNTIVKKKSRAGNSARRRNPRLPSSAVAILKLWMLDENNFECPYPSEDQKVMLRASANITAKQLNNWFTNARKRFWRPLFDEALEYGLVVPTKKNIAKGKTNRAGGQGEEKGKKQKTSAVKSWKRAEPPKTLYEFLQSSITSGKKPISISDVDLTTKELALKRRRIDIPEEHGGKKTKLSFGYTEIGSKYQKFTKDSLITTPPKMFDHVPSSYAPTISPPHMAKESGVEWLEMFVREKSNVSFFQPSFRTGAFCSFANVEHEELKSSVGKNDFGLSNEMEMNDKLMKLVSDWVRCGASRRSSNFKETMKDNAMDNYVSSSNFECQSPIGLIEYEFCNLLRISPKRFELLLQKFERENSGKGEKHYESDTELCKDFAMRLEKEAKRRGQALFFMFIKMVDVQKKNEEIVVESGKSFLNKSTAFLTICTSDLAVGPPGSAGDAVHVKPSVVSSFVKAHRLGERAKAHLLWTLQRTIDQISIAVRQSTSNATNLGGSAYIEFLDTAFKTYLTKQLSPKMESSFQIGKYTNSPLKFYSNELSAFLSPIKDGRMNNLDTLDTMAATIAGVRSMTGGVGSTSSGSQHHSGMSLFDNVDGRTLFATVAGLNTPQKQNPNFMTTPQKQTFTPLQSDISNSPFRFTPSTTQSLTNDVSERVCNSAQALFCGETFPMTTDGKGIENFMDYI